VRRERPDQQPAFLRPPIIFAIHAIVFVLLTWWSWRKWPDPIIDFGRELYVPWQITRGRVLYRDIASLFGPLSSYVNALWFSVFGVSLRTLVFCNLAIFAAMTAAIYDLVRRSTDRVTAMTASLAVLLLFGFAQYGGLGNYNFVTPYSHEATHGLALCVALIICLHRGFTTRHAIFVALAGLSFGLAQLTKPEISLAATTVAVVGFVGAWTIDALPRRSLATTIPIFIVAAAVAPVLFFLYFLQHMPVHEALRAVAGAWAPTFVPGIADNNFYRMGMGLTQPWTNALRMVTVFAVIALFFAALAGACSRNNRALQLAMAGVGIYLAQSGRYPPALPLIGLTALIVFTVLLLRARGDHESALRVLPLVMWSALAIVLLSKMFLNARLNHYGFYLALPVAVSTVALIGYAIPSELARRFSIQASRKFRQLALFTLAGAAVPFMAHTNAWYRTRVVQVGFGPDRIWASNAQGMFPPDAVQTALEDLSARTPTTSFAVLPEGVMMNYLLRRESPLRVLTVMPPEILAFGEDEVLKSLAAAPPDVVVLLQRDVTEYGYPTFGTAPSYGQRTMEWIKARYQVARTIGTAPHDPASPAIQIFERAPAGSAPSAR
jgi:Dolichyl-phosphate-mannose-protein mannosyltransferase